MKNTVALGHRHERLHQPAHRRSRNQRGIRRLSSIASTICRRLYGTEPAAHRVRHASGLRVDIVRPRHCAAAAFRCKDPASLGSRAVVHGGKRRRSLRLWVSHGMEPATELTERSGAASFCCCERRRFVAPRISERFRCPAAMLPSRNPQTYRTSDFSTKSSAPDAFTGQRAAASSPDAGKEHPSSANIERGPAVRCRRVPYRNTRSKFHLKDRLRWNWSFAAAANIEDSYRIRDPSRKQRCIVDWEPMVRRYHR